jgi:hypothetical protein
MKKTIKTVSATFCLLLVASEAKATLSSAFSNFLSAVKSVGSTAAKSAANSAINDAEKKINNALTADTDAEIAMGAADTEIEKSQSDLMSADREMISAVKADFPVEEQIKKSLELIKEYEKQLSSLENGNATSSAVLQVVIPLITEIKKCINLLSIHNSEISTALADAHKLDAAVKELLKSIQDKETVSKETSILLDNSLNIASQKYTQHTK